jgi:hypothetical protein
MAGLSLTRIKPKELKQVPSGRIFGYTDALAERPDMVAIWPDGIDPNMGHEPKTKEEAENIKTGQIREELQTKDKIIANMEAQMADMAKEIEKLNEENMKLRQLNSQDAPTDNPQPDEVPPVASDHRTDNIRKAAAEIIKNGDPNDFTGQGKIRIGRLEAISGVADIDAAERDAAMDNIE